MILRRLSCASLVVALLFAGLPAWEHAHDGGDLSHDHAQDHEHHGMGEVHAHLHVTLFGFEVTLPVDSRGDDQSDGNDDFRGGIATYLVSTPATLNAAQSSLSIAPCEAALDAARPVQVVPTFHAKTAIAAPLCDAARHERSGVLLV